MQKNVANQKWLVYAFDVTTNLPKTGDAAQITANLSKDGAAGGATDDTNPTELEDGYYVFNMLQAESNADILALFPASSTSNIVVIAVPPVIYTRPPNFQTMGIESDGDLTKVNLCATNTDMRGTDSAALAAVCTEGRLSELDAGNIPTDLSALSALINAIDTSTELAARFTEIKGAGWATETLADIRAAITALGGLTGSRNIIIQVYETGGTTPIADAYVSVYNSDQTIHMGTVITDSNGQVSIGRNDGTYKIVQQKAGTVFTVPETILVTKDETFVVYGTSAVIPLPGNPAACNVICDLKDFGLDAKEGVTFTARLTTTPQAASSAILNAEAWSRDTDVTGRAILTLPQGVKFTIFSTALGGDSKTIRIDTAALSSLILADQV